MFRFERLQVWQLSIRFADAVYDATRLFPDDERFGLTAQLRRAAVSVSSNIAEGSGRSSKKDFARFVEMGYSSLMEVVSQLQIARNRSYLSVELIDPLYSQADELARMLSGLRKSLTSG